MPKQTTAKNRRERRALAAKTGRVRSNARADAARSKPAKLSYDFETVNAARGKLAQADKARRAGDLDRATRICETLIEKFPEYVGALHTLGLVHMARNSYWQALSCLVRAAMLSPLDWTILASLGQVYIGLDAIEQAAHTLNQALAVKEDEAEIHYSLGKVYSDQREYELAAETLKRAGTLDPSHDGIFLLLGMVFTHLGDLDGAAAALVKAHKNSPTAVGPIATLAHLPAKFVEIDIKSALDNILNDGKSENQARMESAAFALANFYDKAGQHSAAWGWLEKANAPIAERQKEQLDRYGESYRKKLAAVQSYSYKLNPAGKDRDGPLSLFIMGISRSGKTTVELLFSTVPRVRRGYENPIVENSTRRASQISGLLSLPSLLALPVELDGEFIDFYFEELQQRAQGAAVFTNTHPAGILEVGRLANCIHNVRFVFVRRNRADTALRILLKHYKEGTNAYAYDIQSAFNEIDYYHQLMAEWQSRLPDICLTVNYEDIVDDPATHITQIATLCGIDAEVGDLPPTGDDRGCAEPYAQYFGLK